MKKTHTPTTTSRKAVAVVAVSTIAVVVLAGVSAVSIHSLAKSEQAVQVAAVSSAADDTAAGKALVRPEQVPDLVVYDAVETSIDLEPVYEEPAAQVVEVTAELVVVDSVVEVKDTPEDIPVIVAQVAEAEEITEPETVVLAIADTEPIFLAAEESFYYEEPAEYYEPEFQVMENTAADYEDVQTVVYEEPVYEEPVYEEPVYEEPVYEVEYYEEPVYAAEAEVEVEEPVAEPEYEEPAYEPETTAQSTESISTSGTTSAVRQAIVDYAASRVGVTPYVWAGRSLETGTDCSGFVNLIYDSFGYYASAGSDDYQDVEGDWGTNISYDELQPGDVVVYYDGGHVGIYAGQDEDGTDYVIHDSNEIDGVKISEMNYNTPTAYVRIIDDYEYEEYDDEDYYYEDEDEDYYYASDDEYDEEDYDDYDEYDEEDWEDWDE